MLATELTPLTTNSEKKTTGTATVTQTVLNLMKTCMGTGCLGLAFAAQQGGIVMFSIGTLLVGAWNIVCVERLCKCLQYIKTDELPEEIAELNDNSDNNVSNIEITERDRIRNDVENNDEEASTAQPYFPPTGTSTLSLIAYQAFGKAGLEILDVVMLMLFFGIIMAYIAAFVTFFGDTPFSINRPIDAITSALIMGTIALVPDIGHLSRNSAIGLTILAVTFAVIAAYGIASFKHNNNSHKLVVWPASLTGTAHFFGVCVFGFGITPLTFSIRSSMREPDRMVYATVIALTASSLAYIIAGVGLYACYPDISGELLHELPIHGMLPVATRLAMIIVVFLTAPLLVVPCAELLEGKFQCASQRVLVRYSVCLISAIVAIVVPSFVRVLSLVGCASVGVVSFVLPPLLHWQLTRQQQKEDQRIQEVVADIVLFIAGVVASGYGTIQLLLDSIK